jgi:hypothetical protein
MPVVPTRRRGRRCYKVKNVKTKKCMTKEQAQRQDVAVRISKAKRAKRKGK